MVPDLRRDNDTAVIGCVSFLNSKPLIHGLEDREDIRVRFDVPSALLEDLLGERVDLALCPVIDYQLSPQPLMAYPVTGICCNGPTMTVRLFSRVPMEKIVRVHADTDSHTSIRLLQVLLHDLYSVKPQIEPLGPDFRGMAHEALPEALLLIGDKVVTHQPDSSLFPHEMDLGEAWKRLTGLPFVFATWFALPGHGVGEAPQLLREQQRFNASRIEAIAARFAPPLGWPIDLARDYLACKLHFTLGHYEIKAINHFYARAFALGLIPQHRSFTYVPFESAPV